MMAPTASESNCHLPVDVAPLTLLSKHQGASNAWRASFQAQSPRDQRALDQLLCVDLQ